MTFKIVLDIDGDLALTDGVENFRWLRVENDVNHGFKAYGGPPNFRGWHQLIHNGAELDGSKEVFSGTYEECMSMYDMQKMLGIADEWGNEV